MIYLKNLTAEHEIYVADFYMKRGAYLAAIGRAKYVIENIPNSSETMRALKIIRECYEALGYFELMEDIEIVIKENGGTVIKKSESSSWNFFSRKAPEPSKN